MTWHDVAAVENLREGDRLVVEVAGRSVGVFRVDGDLHAVLNRCPHAGAPVCEGRITGRVVASPTGQVHYDADALTLRCPWHHWEFDLPTGRAVAPGVRQRLKVFETRVADGRIQVRLP
jgi:3-phenylpropionate/trans-cinnamate dioxygenase ferredoxin subunit